MSEGAPLPSGFSGVARIFLLFGLLAGAVLAVGLVLALREGRVAEPLALPALADFLPALVRGSPSAWLSLGAGLLLLLPVARNVAIVTEALRRKDAPMALLPGLFALALVGLYLALCWVGD